MLVYIDPVESPTRQHRKEFSDERDQIAELKGDAKTIPVHVAESLRQVKGSGVPKGGWTGGDAWFGSVSCSVHLKNENTRR